MSDVNTIASYALSLDSKNIKTGMVFDSLHLLVEYAIKEGLIKTYRTKKDAQDAARPFGWVGSVFRHQRRFERIWLIGKIYTHTEYVDKELVKMCRFPSLTWDRHPSNIEYQPCYDFYIKFLGVTDA